MWEIGKGATRREGRKRSEWVEKGVWGMLGFVALVYVWMYFCCCSKGCLCQGFQRTGIMYSWYSRLVNRW
jgi:hypothetical protein